MLRPFEEAVAFVGERVPQNPEFYATLDNESKLRGYTIAGLMKAAALEAAHRLAIQQIAEGTSIGEFNDRLADLIEENDGVLLSRARLDLIFRNNNAISASAGRYRQIVGEGIADARPYGQYPLGPDDSHTTPVCRRLQGLVFPLRSAMAKRIWPPNHHAERHINITTLTVAQAQESQRLYEGPEDDEYPFLTDPETGTQARVMPDPGFDFDPSIFAADGKYLAADATAATRKEIERKTASDYGLAPLADAAAADINRGPPLLGLTLRRDETQAWREFRGAFRFRSDGSTVYVADHAGDGVIVTRESFDAIYAADARVSRYFRFIVPTIEEPYEAWLVPVESESGDVSFLRRYIALYRITGGRIIALVVDRAPNGWLMGARAYEEHELPESERRGLKTFTKSPKKGQSN
jgi:phage-Barnase-EndoU-ColicinE5/D-RelE like nuclease2